MKKIALALLACSMLPTSGYAVMVLGLAGYESMTPKKEEDGKEFTGLGLGALVQFDAVSAKVVSLIVGAGIRNSGLSYSDTILGEKYTVKINETWATGEVGADAAIVPLLLNGQVTASYDYGLTGSMSTDKVSDYAKVDSAGRMGMNARLLVTLFPFVKVGLEGSYNTGSITTVLTEAPKTKTNSDFSGMGIRAVVGVSF